MVCNKKPCRVSIKISNKKTIFIVWEQHCDVVVFFFFQNSWNASTMHVGIDINHNKNSVPFVILGFQPSLAQWLMAGDPEKEQMATALMIYQGRSGAHIPWLAIANDITMTFFFFLDQNKLRVSAFKCSDTFLKTSWKFSASHTILFVGR